MGLENRFGNNNNNDSSKNSDDFSTDDKDKKNSDTSSKSSDTSKNDSFKDKATDKAKGKATDEAMKHVPGADMASGIDTSKYASNLKAMLSGEKSKEEAAKDIAKDAAKDAAKQGAKMAGKAAAQATGEGLRHASPYIGAFLLYLWFQQKLNKLIMAAWNAIFDNPLVAWVINAIGAVVNASNTLSALLHGAAAFFKGLLGTISHAVGGVVHSVAHLAMGAVHLVTGAVSSVANFVGGFFGGASGSSMVASVVTITVQAVTITLPVATVAALGYSIFEPKQSDDAICTVLSAEAPVHYGKLGHATFYKGDPEKTLHSVYNAFRTGGYTAKQTAAILGSLVIEDPSFDPHTVAGDNSGATGIAQWQGDRLKTKMPAYAKKIGAPTIFDLNFQLAYLDYELHSGYPKTLDAMNKAKDVKTAARIFNYGNLTPALQASSFGNMKNTEGGSMYYTYDSSLPVAYGFEGSADRTEKRPDNAQKIYDKYSNSKTDGSDLATAMGNDMISAAQSALGCNKQQDTGDTSDWSGTIKESIPDIGMHWSWNDVPSDIKKYIHSPEDVGMKFNDGGSGWGLPGNVDPEQCTQFAIPYFMKIHGQDPKKNWLYGPDGGGVASAFAKRYGGKVTHRPNQGAVASAAPNTTDNNLATGDYGHVFVVSHVLQNGDIIGLEQNMAWGTPHKALSGTYNNTVSWDVLVLKKSTYTKWGIQFYTPDAKKYPLKWSNK